MIYYYESKKSLDGLDNFISCSDLYKKDHVYFIVNDYEKWKLGIAYEENKGPIICVKIKYRNKSRIYVLYLVSGKMDETRNISVEARVTNIVNLIGMVDGFYSLSVRPGEEEFLKDRCKYDTV